MNETEIRKACRNRVPLDGVDAQILENILTQAEFWRDIAFLRIKWARERLEEAIKFGMNQEVRVLVSSVTESLVDPDPLLGSAGEKSHPEMIGPTRGRWTLFWSGPFRQDDLPLWESSWRRIPEVGGSQAPFPTYRYRGTFITYDEAVNASEDLTFMWRDTGNPTGKATTWRIAMDERVKR
jgi:hypothetical protein